MSQPPPWGPPGDDAEPQGTPPPVPPSPDPVPGSGDPGAWAVPPPYGGPTPYGGPPPPAPPSGQPPYGVPPPGGPAPTYPAPPYGSPPSAPRRGVPVWVWVLVGLGALGMLGVAAVLALVLFAGGGASEEELSRLYDACADGDMGSCDELFRESPLNSEYEEFGDTCGGRTDGGTWCTELDQ